MKSAARKIIVGDWDGKQIWRYETAQEKLGYELYKVFKKP